MATKKAAPRQAIGVNDDRGIYQIALGARPFSFASLRATSAYLRVNEGLVGWGMWQWAVHTDRGEFFVSGDTEPEPFGRVSRGDWDGAYDDEPDVLDWCEGCARIDGQDGVPVEDGWCHRCVPALAQAADGEAR